MIHPRSIWRLLFLFLTPVSFATNVLSREPPGPSSRRTPLAITEIHYHPEDIPDGGNLEFVELYNSNPWPEDIGGFRLAGEIEFTFPAGTMLGARGFAVIAVEPEDVRAAYGIEDVGGPATGRLGNGGGNLRLLKRSGAVILELDYDDRRPWPLAADGAGHSLVLASPSFGEADPRAWESSTFAGGSPGQHDPEIPDDPLRHVRINEVVTWSLTGAPEFLELTNVGADSADLSGCVITGQLDAAHTIADGAVLAPGEFHVIDSAALGAGFSPVSPRFYLWNRERSFIADAFRAEGQAADVAMGQNGELRLPTPGASNAPLLTRQVVINEIMYHPLSERDDDEYLELRNTGAESIDVSGWSFSDGLDFVIPDGTRIAADGHLVIAKNRDRLLQRHPNIPGGSVLGNFDGRLSNSGERIALAMPGIYQGQAFEIIIDEVTYGDGDQWGQWSDGGGSSLELTDPRADNRLASNWADSDESGKAPWTNIVHEGRLDNGKGAADRFQMFLLGAGKVEVDDIVVTWDGRDNSLANGDFAGGDSGWTFQGTHRPSRVEAGVLQIDAVDRGDLVANRVFHRLSPAPRADTDGRISARARWQAGHPELLLRLKGAYLETVAALETPTSPGTPGARNSAFTGNAAPVIAGIAHAPVLPAANETVTITARVADVDDVAAVNLRYRIDPSATINTVPMQLLAPGDNLYGAEIPGQSSRALAAFTIEATDGHPATPASARSGEALILFGDNDYETERFGTYRLWMTAATEREWRTRPKMSNEPLPVTFVYGADRVVHDAGSWFSGSAFTSPGYDSPTGRICGYDIEFPDDAPFLGASQITLDFPVRDPTAQREQLMYWFADQLGLPNNYRRHVHLFVNGKGNRSRGGWGTNSNSIYEDVQQPGADMIREWFPDATGGHLFKGDYWHEFSDTGSRIDPATPNRLESYTTVGGVQKDARHRWNWRPRAARSSANDFSPLYELISAVTADSDRSHDEVAATVDIENWMRTFVVNDLAANWDSFGNGGAKNTFHYKPPADGWKLLSWDFDVGLGVFNDPVTSPLFSASDRGVRNIERDPLFVRHYWQGLREAVQSFFTEEAVTAVTVPKYDALRAAGVRVTSPEARSGSSGLSIPDWVDARRRFLLRQLDDFTDVAFVIEDLPGMEFQQVSNFLPLRGTAPVQTAQILVNGAPLPVVWTDTTAWESHLFLQPGTNELTFSGIDRAGVAVDSVQAMLIIDVTGSPEPIDGKIVINEIMFHPADVPEAEFIELFNRSQSTAYDLSGWNIAEIGLLLPPGSIIPAGGYLVVARDSSVFARIHGSSIEIAAEFAVPLSDQQQALTLIDTEGLTQDRARYEEGDADQQPAFGNGASLQLPDPATDNNHPGNWAVVAPGAGSGPIIAMDEEWRYYQDGAPGAGWNTPGFDDSAWLRGKGVLGVSEALLPHAIQTPLMLGNATYYFRATFDLETVPNAPLHLLALLDDGAAVYINGSEAFRTRLGDGIITDQTFAKPAVPDAELEGPFEIAPSLLVPGANSIAAELHQSVLNSADLVFGLELSGGASQAPFTPGAANSVTGVIDDGITDLTVTLTEDGAVIVTFTTPDTPGASFVLRYSSDLTAWLQTGPVIPPATEAEIIDAPPPGARFRYYRVIEIR